MRQQYDFIRGHALGSRAPLKAWLNFIRWQLASRLSSGPVRRRWIGGSALMVKRGMTGATGNLYVGLHEFADMGFLLHFLRPGDLFVDVGANIGSYSVLAGRVCGAHVVAFEPDAGTAAALNDNVRANDLGGLVSVEVSAVGETPGTVNFSRHLDTVNYVLADGEASDAAQEVTITTLDIALTGRAPSMIKIDVEGHEPAVIAGAESVLASPSLRAIVLESVDDATLQTLTRHGFERTSYDPFTRVLRPDPRSSAGNTLFIRDIASVAAKVATGAAFTALGQRV